MAVDRRSAWAQEQRRSWKTLAILIVVPTLQVGALAAPVYSCVIDGVKTYTDSPRRCPTRTEQERPVPSSHRLPGSGTAAQAIAPTVKQIKGSRSNAACSAVGTHESGRPQECMAEGSRDEIRRIAEGRFKGLRTAMTEFLGMPSRTDGEIAVAKEGRPVEWCRNVLNDLRAARQVDVIDDEAATVPAWLGSATPGQTRRAAPVLDPDFKEHMVDGVPLVAGYVSLRWRSQPVVLRLVAACVPAGDGRMVCNPQRYTNLYVYDDATPIACNVSFVARPYWDQWSASMRPLRLE